MELKVLAVGDVVGTPGLERIRRSLRYLKRKTGADFVIVNGENAAAVGMTPQQGEDILDAGADVITRGNHTFDKRELVPWLEDCPQVLRPANYAPQTPGKGWGVFETKAGPVAVVDLIGRCHMDFSPDNPFLMIDKILKEVDAKIAEQAASVSKETEEYKKGMDPRQFDYIRSDIVITKLFDFLKSNNEMVKE